MKCSRWVTYTCWKTVHVCFLSVNFSTSQDFLFIGNLLGPHGYKGECVQARHVDYNVPIFRFQCELQYGLILLSLAGGNPEIHVQAENAEFQQAPSGLGRGAEVGEAEANRVPRTESAEASPESSEVHHCASAEEAAACRAPRGVSAEEGSQDSPADETWVDNLPAGHLMTSCSFDARLQAKLYESPHI